jgi:putative nucleotidyltransferase with HDIG domain
LGKTDLNQDARIGLIDGTGQVLARYPDVEKVVGRSLSGSPFFKILVAQGGRGVAETPGFEGVPRIYGFAHFAETMMGPIYVWVGVSRDLVVAEGNRRALVGMLFALGLAAVLLAGLWVGSDRYLVRPITAMAEAARKLGQGQYDARTGVPHGRDELGQLAGAIDTMASALMSKSELLRINRAYAVLSRCNRSLIRAESEDALQSEVCNVLVETGGFRMCWVGVAEEGGDKRVRPVAYAGFNDGYLEAAQVSWADSERGHGPTGTAIRTGEPQVNQDYLTNPRMEPWRVEAVKRGFRSSAAFPLTDRGRVFGSLTIYSQEANAYSEEEMRLLSEFADDLSFGIVTLRIKAAHKNSLERLERSVEATIRAIAYTVEARDPYTAGHQWRVAELAAAIAHELGMPEDEVRGLKLTGAIHDVGKVGIPAEILSKPSKLTKTEMALIRTHAELGYEILRNIDFPWPIAEVLRQHHERLDGSGYPRGLKGDQILMGARILAVADVVEAMSSHRPYRAALGLDAALGEIYRNRGRVYDDSVCDACTQLIRNKGYDFPNEPAKVRA